jgi:two-component system KDP operon response regulator KdpE
VARVLVVDPDAGVRRALRTGLGTQGYLVEETATCAGAIDRIASSLYDAVVLDLRLPDDDGRTVVRRVREWSDVPIIVLSVDGHDWRKVEALDDGADDYVTKPFSMPELLARVRVAMRHRAGASRQVLDQSVFEVGDLRIDVAHHTCLLGGVEIDLTPKEFAILATLARWPGQVVTHRLLLHEVWGPDYVGETQYLRTYATNIRRKLGCTAEVPRLVAEPGVGYRLVAVERERALAVAG